MGGLDGWITDGVLGGLFRSRPVACTLEGVPGIGASALLLYFHHHQPRIVELRATGSGRQQESSLSDRPCNPIQVGLLAQDLSSGKRGLLLPWKRPRWQNSRPRVRIEGLHQPLDACLACLALTNKPGPECNMGSMDICSISTTARTEVVNSSIRAPCV